MANKPLDTALLDRAIVFAVHAHAGTERRGKGFPYIVHPMEAVAIVSTMTADQELLAAAALHDTVEETDVTVDQLRAEFGDRIARLVADESDEFEAGVSEEDSWHARKRAAIERLARMRSAVMPAVPMSLATDIIAWPSRNASCERISQQPICPETVIAGRFAARKARPSSLISPVAAQRARGRRNVQKA